MTIQRQQQKHPNLKYVNHIALHLQAVRNVNFLFKSQAHWNADSSAGCNWWEEIKIQS